MKRPSAPFFLFALLVLATITLACGSSTTRSVQSVALSPATADAQNSPNGQVQFTATGYYNTSPTQVTPLTATWGTCDQSATTTNVSVTTSGVAQCAVGASGTYTVWAFVSNAGTATCNVLNVCGGGCGRVTGTAQLTCP